MLVSGGSECERVGVGGVSYVTGWMCKCTRGGGMENEGRSHAGVEPRPSGFLKRAGAGQLAARNIGRAFIFHVLLSRPQVSSPSQGPCSSLSDPGVRACGVSGGGGRTKAFRVRKQGGGGLPGPHSRLTAPSSYKGPVAR